MVETFVAHEGLVALEHFYGVLTSNQGCSHVEYPRLPIMIVPSG